MALELPAIITDHPGYTVGIVVVGAAVVYLYMSSGSSSNATAVPRGADPVATAANVQLAGLSASANSQTSAQNFQLSAKQLDISGANYSTDASVTVALAQLKEQAAASSASLQVALQENANANEAQKMAIAAQERTAIAGLTTQKEIADIAAREQTHIADSQASVVISQIASNQYIAGLNTYSQVVATNANRDVSIAVSNNQAQVGIAQTNAAVAIAKSSGGNSIGGILGGVGSLLGALL